MFPFTEFFLYAVTPSCLCFPYPQTPKSWCGYYWPSWPFIPSINKIKNVHKLETGKPWDQGFDLVVVQSILKSPLDIASDSIMAMLNHCLRNFYYNQTTGVPMGSAISSLIAEAVMQNIEDKIMAQFRPRLSFRYVDAMFVIRKIALTRNLSIQLQ